MLRKIIEHKINPLHVYCRLVENGCSKKRALKLAKVYEVLIYWIIKRRG